MVPASMNTCRGAVMSIEDGAPKVAGAADPAEDQPKNGAETPSTEDQAGASEDALFDEEETKNLPPEAEKRVKGFQRSYTKKMQELASRDKEMKSLLSELKAQRETLEPSAEPGSPAAAQAKSKMEALLSRVKPEEQGFIKELVDTIREELGREVAPIADAVQQTRNHTEVTSLRTRYKDFDQVVSPDGLRDLLKRYPSIDSYEVAYKTLKHETLEREYERSQQELGK